MMVSFERFKFSRDHRADLPLIISRFTGYRPPGQEQSQKALLFLRWLNSYSQEQEDWLLGFIGSFIGILLIEAIMSTSTAFRDVYHAPTIITSFAASAVLLFGTFETPFAQPRNFVLGHFISALVGTVITRLYVLDGRYLGYLNNSTFHATTFTNGGLSTAISIFAMMVTGTIHPPAGATALNAAVQSQVVIMSWRYLPTILASSLIMLGWALIVNNVGRRRYPTFWWSSEPCFVRQRDEKERLPE